MFFYYSHDHEFDLSIKIFKWLLKTSMSPSVNIHTLKRSIEKKRYDHVI